MRLSLRGSNRYSSSHCKEIPGDSWGGHLKLSICCVCSWRGYLPKAATFEPPKVIRGEELVIVTPIFTYWDCRREAVIPGLQIKINENLVPQSTDGLKKT